MKKVWALEIVDEHSMFGGCSCTLYSTKEKAITAAYNYVKDALNERIVFSDREKTYHLREFEMTDFKTALLNFERQIQRYYQNWEYGGNYFIDVICKPIF